LVSPPSPAAFPIVLHTIVPSAEEAYQDDRKRGHYGSDADKKDGADMMPGHPLPFPDIGHDRCPSTAPSFEVVT
jgi:hypothetical protein